MVTEKRRLVGDVRPGPPVLVLVEVGDPTAEAALRDFWVSWGRRQGATANADFYRLLYGLAWITPGS